MTTAVLKPAHTTDFVGQLVFLGTGTSVGVPALACGCDVCTGGHPKNQRTRCSVILGLPGGNLLIDTPPELRLQLLREQIGIVHAVLFTHEHADHLFGLDDLRLFPFYTGCPVPLYCEPDVERRIRTAYDYAFSDRGNRHPGATPQLTIESIGTDAFEVLGETVRPLRLKHGEHFDVLGFRIGNVAYCTDTNEIPEESMAVLEGVDTLILDALRYKPHTTHFCIDEAIEISRRLGVRQTYLTHMCHDIDHDELSKQLPANVQPAYDGLRIPLC
ncbi:MAG: MBL fold metallo-hydrolase [Planctomycetota bacterium]